MSNREMEMDKTSPATNVVRLREKRNHSLIALLIDLYRANGLDTVVTIGVIWWRYSGRPLRARCLRHYCLVQGRHSWPKSPSFQRHLDEGKMSLWNLIKILFEI
jgi:hypothetical protein